MTKYKAKKTEVNGIVFASKKEANRFSELMLLALAGEIRGLELQPKFTMRVNGKKICDYIADFKYRTKDEWIVEDVKGYKTPVYKLKSKLFDALWGDDYRLVET